MYRLTLLSLHNFYSKGPNAAPPYDDYDDDGLQQPPQHEYDVRVAYNASDYTAAQCASCTDFADSCSPFCPEAPGPLRFAHPARPAPNRQMQTELQPQMPAPPPYKEEDTDDVNMLWPDRSEHTHDAGAYPAHHYDYEYDYVGSPDSEPTYPDDTPSPLWPAPPLPYQQHRSYTLAAAITPLPSHAPSRMHARSSSPAPMASLRPPEPTPAPIKTGPKLEPGPAPEPAPDPPRRPRKRPAALLSREPLAFPYPQLLPGPVPSHSPSSCSSSASAPPRPASPVMGAPETMLLDEVIVPDREGKPEQAINKLTAVAGGGAGGADGGARREVPKKKPVMACLFCRERKIACGPPAPGSAEARCNQCTRRSLRCEYPKESRRGQHKRGPRAMHMQALGACAGELRT